MTHAFLRALAFTLDFEGGDKFTDHPSDHGGKTKWGITESTLDAHIAHGECLPPIENLTLLTAMGIYWTDYWLAAGCDEIEDRNIAAKCFDQCVNLGASAAGKLLQRAVNKVVNAHLVEDGVVGPVTIAATNHANPDALISALMQAQADRYLTIVDHDQTQAVFLRGWLRRSKYNPARMVV